MHNDTAYGLQQYNEDGPSEVVRRITVDTINGRGKIEQIKDPHIRQSLLDSVDGLSDEGHIKEAVRRWCNKQRPAVRRVKIVEKESVIPIKDRQGKAYKAYKGDSNAFMDIYVDPESKKWRAEIVSRFDANQRGFVPEWQRKHPELKRKMRLRKDDVLGLMDEGEEILLRVQKLSGNTIILAPLNEGNVDKRNRAKEDPFKFIYKSPSSLQKMQAYKVHISPTGLLRRADR